MRRETGNGGRTEEDTQWSNVSHPVKGDALTGLLRACFDAPDLHEYSRLPWLRLLRMDGNGTVCLTPQTAEVELSTGFWVWQIIKRNDPFELATMSSQTTPASVVVRFKIPDRVAGGVLCQSSTHTLIRFGVDLKFGCSPGQTITFVTVSNPCLNEFRMSTFKWH